MTKLFIDGAAGTVGMAIAPHLKQLLKDGLLSEVAMLGDDCRKIRDARLSGMAEADIVLLCLPDDIARDAACMAANANPDVRILDASAAHRCDEDWQYGMPELFPDWKIGQARRVANPGCFATGCILLAEPLTQGSDLLPGPTHKKWMAFQGVTGYSAAGVKAQDRDSMPYLTGMGTEHRHLPEIQLYSRVLPALSTIVGDWYQGMLVQSTILAPAEDVFDAYCAAYEDQQHITVTLAKSGDRRLSAVANNGTNDVSIMVAEQPDGFCVVAAAFDNLGKGSAGAAAHNLRLMLTYGCK
jgi:N-acetyl-gamma-glutamyl-phosphate reductase